MYLSWPGIFTATLVPDLAGPPFHTATVAPPVVGPARLRLAVCLSRRYDPIARPFGITIRRVQRTRRDRGGGEQRCTIQWPQVFGDGHGYLTIEYFKMRWTAQVCLRDV